MLHHLGSKLTIEIVERLHQQFRALSISLFKQVPLPQRLWLELQQQHSCFGKSIAGAIDVSTMQRIKAKIEGRLCRRPSPIGERYRS
jgi:hypothetical protein